MRRLLGRARRLVSRLWHASPQPAGVPIDEAIEQQELLPHFAGLIERDLDLWARAVATPNRTPVLVATSTGEHHPLVVVEGMLCAALTLRGANPHVLLCDGVLPACTVCDIYRYPDVDVFLETGPQIDRCAGCFANAAAMYNELGVTVHRYSTYLSEEDYRAVERQVASVPADELASLVIDQVSVGEHALAGALRFFAKGDLKTEANGEAVLRRYVRAAILTALVTERVQTKIRPEVCVFHHGIYVPMGITGDVMRRERVRVVNWNVAYRKKCFIFSHGDTYHRTMMDEPTDTWESMPWGPEQQSAILEYLKARWHGASDWILVQEGAETNAESIASELGIDFAVPTLLLLTNVVWDAQLFYESNAFPDMMDWIAETIRYVSRRRDLQLVIRVHPAEVTGTLVSRQPVLEEIRSRFSELPANVFVIGPEQKLSTYALAEQCDSVAIYGTKTGVEAAAMGIPVIVAGEAWIRGKGITLDASSADEYLSILDGVPLNARLEGEQLERARRYAFHFFMRRMIPIEFMEPTNSWPPFEVAVDRIGLLGSGHSRGLDIICDGILKGGPFIYTPDDVEAGA